MRDKWFSTIFILLVASVSLVVATNDKVVIKEWDVPTANSLPHDPAIAPDGALWYTGQRSNTLGRFDPKTKSFATWPIPSGGGVVRHMVATPTDDLYIACSGVNKVGVVNVAR